MNSITRWKSENNFLFEFHHYNGLYLETARLYDYWINIGLYHGVHHLKIFVIKKSLGKIIKEIIHF